MRIAPFISLLGIVTFSLLAACEKGGSNSEEPEIPVYEDEQDFYRFWSPPIPGVWGYSPSYIQSFVVADRLSATFYDYTGVPHFHIRFDGEEIEPEIVVYGWEIFPGGMFILDSAKIISNEAFDRLCRRFEDTHFNDTTYYSYPHALADRFTSVELISDKPFDKKHPAGKSLGDIVRLWSASSAPFIESGYLKPPKVIKGSWEAMAPSFYRDGPYDYPINKLLSQLTSNDLKLMNDHAVLKFETIPPPGTHLFTITFRSADKTLSTNVEVTFP